MPKLEVPVSLKPQIDPTGLANFEGLIEQVKTAQGLLDFSKLTGDQKFISEAEENLERLRKRVTDFAGNIKAAMDAANIPLEQQRKIMAEIVRLAKEMADGAKSSGKLADNVRSVTTAGRGLLAIANNMGRIDDEASRTVESVLQLADAIAVLQTKGIGLAGALGGVVGLVGGAVGLLNSIGVLGDSPMEQERARLLKQNNEELARLRLELSGFTDSAAEQVALSQDLIALTFGPGSRFKEQVEALGFSMDELAALAQKAGIEIFDSAGNIIPEALHQWGRALQLAADAALQFGKTFADEQTKLDLLNRARGIPDSAAQQVADSVKLFQQFAPKVFEEFFAGIDLGDAAAMRVAIEKFLLAWFAGAIPSGDFGKFVNESEITGIIDAWLSGVEKMAEAADEVTAALLGIPAGYRIERARFEATLPFVNTNLIPQLQPPQFPTVPTPLTPVLGPTPGALPSLQVQNLYLTSSAANAEALFSDIQKVLRRKARSQSGIDKTLGGAWDM